MRGCTGYRSGVGQGAAGRWCCGHWEVACTSERWGVPTAAGAGCTARLRVGASRAAVALPQLCLAQGSRQETCKQTHTLVSAEIASRKSQTESLWQTIRAAAGWERCAAWGRPAEASLRRDCVSECAGEEARGPETNEGSRVVWERRTGQKPQRGDSDSPGEVALLGEWQGIGRGIRGGWIVGVGVESGKLLERCGVVLGRAGRDGAGSGWFGGRAPGPRSSLCARDQAGRSRWGRRPRGSDT